MPLADAGAGAPAEELTGGAEPFGAEHVVADAPAVDADAEAARAGRDGLATTTPTPPPTPAATEREESILRRLAVVWLASAAAASFACRVRRHPANS